MLLADRKAVEGQWQAEGRDSSAVRGDKGPRLAPARLNELLSLQ